MEKLSVFPKMFVPSIIGETMATTKTNGKKVGLGGYKKLYKIYWDGHFDPDWGVLLKEALN